MNRCQSPCFTNPFGWSCRSMSFNCCSNPNECSSPLNCNERRVRRNSNCSEKRFCKKVMCHSGCRPSSICCDSTRKPTCSCFHEVQKHDEQGPTHMYYENLCRMNLSRQNSVSVGLQSEQAVRTRAFGTQDQVPVVVRATNTGVLSCINTQTQAFGKKGAKLDLSPGGVLDQECDKIVAEIQQNDVEVILTPVDEFENRATQLKKPTINDCEIERKKLLKELCLKSKLIENLQDQIETFDKVPKSINAEQHKINDDENIQIHFELKTGGGKEIYAYSNKSPPSKYKGKSKGTKKPKTGKTVGSSTEANRRNVSPGRSESPKTFKKHQNRKIKK